MIKILGCRGTNSVSGENFNRYSNYTSSLLITDNDEAFIFDMGTGILNISPGEISTIKKYHIFFSHLHWDHLMGIFAFKPFFYPDVTINFYMSSRYGFRTYRSFLSGIFKAPFYPVSYNIFSSKMKLFSLNDTASLNFKNVKISSVKGNHPNFALIYKIDIGNNFSAVYATDYEHSPESDESLVKFSKGADYLIYDTTYLPDDYEGIRDKVSKVGWGHSTYKKGCEIATRASVKNFVLFHHNPEYEDTVIEQIFLKSIKLFPDSIIAKDKQILC